MNKIILSTSLIMLSFAAFSQSDKASKVKTKYLRLPSYDVTAINPSTIKLEFAMGDTSFGSVKLKDTKSKCVPKGGGLKDVFELTSYHYEMPQFLPESYIVAKSENGTVVYAQKSSKSIESSTRFGYDEKMKQSLCQYWQADILKKDWASNEASFKVSESTKYMERIFNEANEKAINNTSMNYVYQEFEVYTAKGKSFDYSDLDIAFEKAISAYEGINQNGYNDKDFEFLKEAIVIWEKEISTANLDDKKSRINKKIAKGLEENCTRAYFHLMDYENATKHAKSFQNLFGNLTTNRTTNFKLVQNRITKQGIAADKNVSITSDIISMHEMASAPKDNLVSSNLGTANLSIVKGDFDAFMANQSNNAVQASKDDEEAAIASGELNPYQKYYITAMAGGGGVIMNMPPSALSGIPELTEFPKEICQFTEAKQVMILRNKIASIPADISKMVNLRKLDLSNNKLTSLPSEIGALENLEVLKLANNPLESIPAELSNCSNLKTLVLKGTKVPEEQIKELQLKLPNCKIKS